MKTASEFHNHQSNVNQNYNEVLSHLNWNGYYEKKVVINSGKEERK